MRAVVQRVASCSVTVEQRTVDSMGEGLLVYLGICEDDDASDARYMAEKIINLRIYEDARGKMNRSLLDQGGELFAISQFTLYGDTRKGRRPSYNRAAPPDTALPLYGEFISQVQSRGIAVHSGEFGAHMDVQLVNRGPVTILIDSEKQF